MQTKARTAHGPAQRSSLRFATYDKQHPADSASHSSQHGPSRGCAQSFLSTVASSTRHAVARAAPAAEWRHVHCWLLVAARVACRFPAARASVVDYDAATTRTVATAPYDPRAISAEKDRWRWPAAHRPCALQRREISELPSIGLVGASSR